MLALLVATALAAAPADTARRPASTLPRLTATLATATRTVYLQRAPQSQDDRGYLGFTALYQAPSGFVASGYLNHSYAYTFLDEPYLNYGEAMVGWQSTGNGDTYWTAQYTRLFVYQESALVQAGLTNDLSGTVTHYFDALTASADADLFVGRKADFVLTLDVSHPFELPALAHDTLRIEPTLELGAGSQRFYTASLAKTSEVKRRKNGSTTTVLSEPSSPAFSVLGFTLSVPITYTARRWSLAATPSYLVPLSVPEGGDSRSFFYGTLGLSFFVR